MTKKNTPFHHDSFFKLLMDSVENVEDLLTAALPDDILENLDFSTLKNKNTTFVDRDLSNFQADVVYECQTKTGKSVFITLLLEHKSTISQDSHFQMLGYMSRIWLSELKNKRIPRKVLPILFYHGQKKWTYKPFIEYFEGGDSDPELNRFVPNFDYFFLNLQEKDDGWIPERIDDLALQMALKLMKAIKSPDLLEMLNYIFDGVEKLKETEKGRFQFEEIWLYLNLELNTSDEKIQAAMDHETYMRIMPIPEGTPLWRMMQKEKEAGEAEGIAKGKAEGIKKVAMKMLKAGMEVDQISEFTGMTFSEIEKMK